MLNDDAVIDTVTAVSRVEEDDYHEEGGLLHHDLEKSTAFKRFKWKWVLFSVIVATIIYFVPILPSNPIAHRSLSLLLLTSCLWASEAIPLYATGMLVPLLVVWFGCLLDENGKQLTTTVAAHEIANSMFDPVILLFLGGFSLSRALDKFHLNEKLAHIVLRRAGTRPPHILLAMMALGTFLSMWVSNVAASVLCVSVLMPIIHSLGRDEPFAKGLLVGIAFACNTGGMSTPIASPQNAIAMAVLGQNGASVSFIEWIGVAFPCCIILVFANWAIVLHFFPPTTKCIHIPLKSSKQPFRPRHYFVLTVVVATIVLWCLSSITDHLFTGNIGITAALPVVLLFGSGLLTQHDFDRLSWSVLMLMAGGLALGHAVESSQLLSIMSQMLGAFVEGKPEWVALAAFIALVSPFSVFVSNAVSAIVVLPIGSFSISYPHLFQLEKLVWTLAESDY